MFRKIVGPILKIAVSVALIWLVLRNLDLGLVWLRLSEISAFWLTVAVAMLLIQYLFCALRWRAVLRALDLELPMARILAIFWIGTFFNQALPSAVGGDAVRIYKLYKAGNSLGAAFNGVMLERAATVYALAIVVVAMLPALSGVVAADEMAWITPSVVGLVAAGTAGLGAVMLLDKMPTAMRRWRVVRGLAELAADARRVFLAPVSCLKVMGWAILGHANLCVAPFALLIGIGEDVSYPVVLALFPLVILATTIPVSIAGWGVREVSMIAAFALVGVSTEGATAVSLLVGFLFALASLPGGIFWLVDGRADDDPGPEAALAGRE